jgi:hypothetical protein
MLKKATPKKSLNNRFTNDRTHRIYIEDIGDDSGWAFLGDKI